MAESDTTVVPQSSESSIRPQDWAVAVELLQGLLTRNAGCVSSQALRKELEERGISAARDLCVRLRFYDPESQQDGQLLRPSFSWNHKGRSFYSDSAFSAAQSQVAAGAESSAAAELEAEPPSQEEERGQPRRQYRQEEARLVWYVREALESIYASDFAPDDSPVAFDVHNERAGSAFENVDAIAVYWRSPEVVEFVAVEVKLEFAAGAVQQTYNYARFAHRVWLAVPVKSRAEEAGLELRESDPRLFEYVTRLGIGVLGCKRGRGSSYDVFPLQWPQLWKPDEIEQAEFIERHRSVFEGAHVIEPRVRDLPRIR